MCCLVMVIAHLRKRLYMSMKQRWNGDQQGKTVDLDKILHPRHSVHRNLI
jgi:hypothetical protein